jgi:STE24 endopeptidase
MMPLTLIAALFLAFGLDARAGASAALAWPEPARRAAWALGGVTLVAATAFALGALVDRRVRRLGYASSRLRRGYRVGTRAIAALGLGVFAGILHLLDWPAVVRSAFGGRGWPVVSDVSLLLPFLLAEMATWWGLFPAERLLHEARTGGDLSLKRYLVRRERQAVGLLLPVLLVYSLGQDLLPRLLPSAAASPWAQHASLVLMAALVLSGSPFFLRIAWPTAPLPPGPLRDRLEGLARRQGFRCTDILVWDTGGLLVNAGVTGTLPWYRYVLLTDALVENLTPDEVAAVFGHEIGHIAHRHLLSFGVFFLGTVGVMAVINGALDQYVLSGLAGPVGEVVEAGGRFAALGLYFFLAFGLLSRQFERQADLFGCRAVSCGRTECPPHLDAGGAHDAAPPARPEAVCPTGIRTFVNALTNVAALNGMGRDKPSWRHGSIARRVAFLESLEGRPEAERHFQRGVAGLRLALALVLSLAWWWASSADWLDKL